MTTPAPSPNIWMVAFAVSLATFMEVLDTTIVNVSLPHIGGSLAASQEESTWVMTSYLVSNGIILPLSGWLAGAIGRKKYFMLCIAAFTVASFFCGAATSLAMLIVFRLIQGIAGGGLQPTQQAILLDTFPPDKRGQAYAITGITMIVAPIIGPTLGGLITDNFDWRWIFFINIPVGLFAMMMIRSFVHEAPHKKQAHKVDYMGMGFVALGIGSIQIVLDKGQQSDWFGSDFIVTMAAVGICSLAFAVWWILRQENPLVDLRLMKLPSFGIACAMIFFMGFSLYSGSIFLPLLVQTQFGYDATLSGFILSPGGLSVTLLMPLVGRLVNKYPPKYLIAAGFAICGAGMFYTSHFSPDTNLGTFISMRIMQVLGLPFLFIPISTMAFIDVPRHLNNKASALYSLFRNLGGSFGIALMATYQARHAQLWQARLAAHATAYSLPLQKAMHNTTTALTGAGVPAVGAAPQAKAMIYRHLLQQSEFLAYVDSFQTLSWIMLLLVPVALLIMPARHPGRMTAAVAH